MATRRMFSKIITNSDPFLEMPVSSQNLYFHLGMNADDDGFVQVKSVMKQLGSGEDDLKVLLTKGFLIRFADGVIVITAWKVNNEIRGDRYKPTYYQEHLEKLEIESNRCYSLIPEKISVNSLVVPDDNQMTTKCQPVGDTGKVSIGKVSIDQINNDDSFEIFWNLYNKKVNPKLCKSMWKKIDPELHQFIFNHVREYVKNKPDKQFRKDPERYLKYEMWQSEIVCDENAGNKKESISDIEKRLQEKYG